MSAKGVDALSGAALAGKKGGVMLLVSAQPAIEKENLTTVEGTDSAGDASFLSAHADEVAQTYVLGGKFVVPEAFVDDIKAMLEVAI